jgi:type II secretory pathway pseudopilin PulG
MKGADQQKGFSLVEVVVASVIMIVLCIAALSAFSYASSVNRGNNLRSQSLSILQDEIEYYRGLTFTRSAASADLNAGTYIRGNRTSGDGTMFQVVVLIKNLPNPPSTAVPSDAEVTLKEIKVSAERPDDQGKWFGGTSSITMLRVRAN